MKPIIKKVADVSHLTRSNDEKTLINRRDFMIKLFKAGVVIGVPSILLNACSKNDPIVNPEDEGTGNPVKILSRRPTEAQLNLENQNGTYIDVKFDRFMDRQSVFDAFSIKPLPPRYDRLEYIEDTQRGTSTIRVFSNTDPNFSNPLADNTEYIVKIKDTAKDKDNNKIDGDDNGESGGDFIFSFATGNMPPPTVISYRPADANVELSSTGRKDTSIKFSHKMEEETVIDAFNINPLPLEYNVKFYEGLNSIGLTNGYGETQQPKYAPNTQYTITIKGTAKDFYGNFLDGNEDGIGGDDFSFTFVTNDYSAPCTCESYTCTCVGNQCSCQGHTCTCVSFTCPCQFNGCSSHI